MAEAAKARDNTQSELDDLLMVFADLEEKVQKYKVRACHSLVGACPLTKSRVASVSLGKQCLTAKTMTTMTMQVAGTMTMLTKQGPTYIYRTYQGAFRLVSDYTILADGTRILRMSLPFRNICW